MNTTIKRRAAFEEWIKSSPYERNIEQWPNDPDNCAWPDQYKDFITQLAWDAWYQSELVDYTTI